jgi:hypothetical protein
MLEKGDEGLLGKGNPISWWFFEYQWPKILSRHRPKAQREGLKEFSTTLYVFPFFQVLVSSYNKICHFLSPTQSYITRYLKRFPEEY